MIKKVFFLIFLSIFLSVNAQLHLYQKCGGVGFIGSSQCVNGATCFKQNEYYAQCLTSCPSWWDCSILASSGSQTTQLLMQIEYGQCGGSNWNGPYICVPGFLCYKKNDYYSQCLTSCPNGWDCFESILTKVSTSFTLPFTSKLTKTSKKKLKTTKITTTSTENTSLASINNSTILFNITENPIFTANESTIVWQTGDWAFGCDFNNNDLINVQTTGADCGQTCYNNPHCTHFTWTTFNNGTCWLKYGPISKTDAFQTNNYSMVCGIVVRPTLSSSTTTLSSVLTNSQTTVTDGNNNFTQDYSTIFPYCKFRFGYAYSSSPFDYSIVDYITIWIGWNQFNQYWEGDMLKKCVSYSKIPVFYAYFIAFMSRQDWNLQDCNVGSPSLCQKGAEYIRQYRTSIVNNYKSYATSIANIIGVNIESIWLIEPNFWQYYGDLNQVNGPLSGIYMRSFFDDIVGAIKSQLPNARISWDISAWIGESGMKTWWSYFSSSPYIDYIHTSGGESRAELSQIKPNELSWSFMSTLTGKKIIADTGYGVGGGGTGHNTAYDNYNNLVSRINDGVVAVSQVSADSSWVTIINNLRATLPSVCSISSNLTTESQTFSTFSTHLTSRKSKTTKVYKTTTRTTTKENNEIDFGIELSNVIATRQEATEQGACVLPDVEYNVTNPVSLGDINSLGYLKFHPDLCGHVLSLNCGNGDFDIIITNSNFGGGLDLYESTWEKATNNLPPGIINCNVKLTSRNPMQISTKPICFYIQGEGYNRYFQNVALFNTGIRIVNGATLKGIKGTHRGNNPYYAFDTFANGSDQVIFTFNDGSKYSVKLSDCIVGINAKQNWN